MWLQGRIVNTSRSSDNPPLDFGESELGILFGNDDITVKDHLSPSTKGSPIHRRNDWFVEGLSPGDRAKTMRHTDQFLLIAGDLSTDTGVVSFQPPDDDGESR